MEETEVLIETSMGDMKVKLYNDTPKHRDNFITRLRAVSPGLFAQVQAVLARNKAERHLRGGAATRRKYQHSP